MSFVCTVIELSPYYLNGVEMKTGKWRGQRHCVVSHRKKIAAANAMINIKRPLTALKRSWYV